MGLYEGSEGDEKFYFIPAVAKDASVSRYHRNVNFVPDMSSIHSQATLFSRLGDGV